jgi:hypothetical protein
MWSSDSKSRAAGRALLAAIAVLTLASSPARAQTAAPVAATPPAPAAPPPPARPRNAFILVGASLFMFPYLASVVSATTGYPAGDSTDSSRTILWVPVVGPFVMMGSTHGAGASVALLLDGLAQTAGLTSFVYGKLVEPAPSPATTARGVTLTVTPWIDTRTTGAGVMGRF